jgi:hypothetical protein
MATNPTKLFKATVGFDLYMLAGDEDDARGVAICNAATEMDNLSPGRCVAAVAEVADVREIAAERRHARPYATAGTALATYSCEGALSEIRAVARRADLPGQKNFPEGLKTWTTSTTPTPSPARGGWPCSSRRRSGCP